MRDITNVITPKEFKEKMLEYSRFVDKTNDLEQGKYEAEKVVCDLLTSLGYSEGAEIFSCLGYYI